MKIIGVIPARAESSRFYNKPLAKILGKPMIQWVYEHAKAASKIDEGNYSVPHPKNLIDLT